LREEGLTYAGKLADAGVPTRIRRDADVLHGYLGAAGFVEAATEAVAEAGAWMRGRLGAPAVDEARERARGEEKKS
jgi:acetyl esterase